MGSGVESCPLRGFRYRAVGRRFALLHMCEGTCPRETTDDGGHLRFAGARHSHCHPCCGHPCCAVWTQGRVSTRCHAQRLAVLHRIARGRPLPGLRWQRRKPPSATIRAEPRPGRPCTYPAVETPRRHASTTVDTASARRRSNRSPAIHHRAPARPSHRSLPRTRPRPSRVRTCHQRSRPGWRPPWPSPPADAAAGRPRRGRPVPDRCAPGSWPSTTRLSRTLA